MKNLDDKPSKEEAKETFEYFGKQYRKGMAENLGSLVIGILTLAGTAAGMLMQWFTPEEIEEISEPLNEEIRKIDNSDLN